MTVGVPRGAFGPLRSLVPTESDPYQIGTCGIQRIVRFPIRELAPGPPFKAVLGFVSELFLQKPQKTRYVEGNMAVPAVAFGIKGRPSYTSAPAQEVCHVAH